MVLLSLPLVAASVDEWPRWRGPFSNGMAKTAGPVEWSGTKNVVWKTPIPGRGFSTPVFWGDKMFVTTAVPQGSLTAQAAGGASDKGTAAGVEHKFLVLALDRKTGKIIWQQTATVARPHEGYHHKYGSFASSSPVTDGDLVYAFFGSRGLYAYDLGGTLIWKKDFPPMQIRLQSGEGAAAVLAEDRLILLCDQESDSFIVALDKKTGQEIWRKTRDEVSSWSQPLAIEHNGRKQVIVAASAKVRSYDLKTGDVIWECSGLGTSVIPAPVYEDGVVYVMSGHREPNLLAIKLGKTGDLTGTDAVVWTNQRGNSYTASPVLHEGKLYFVTDTGMVSCFDAKTGKPYYHQVRLPKPYSFKASPIGAGGKLYLATEQGDVLVLKMGDKYDVLATNTMADEFFVASPTLVDGSLYLRSSNAIYCIRQ